MKQAFIRCCLTVEGLVWEIYDRSDWRRLGHAATAAAAIAAATRMGYDVD